MSEQEFWEVTQEEVQPCITKPTLTEKLLKKPPFRFIHDVFTNMTVANGFGEGVLQGSDANSGSFTEKAAKAACLRRIIEYVSIINKREIDVDAKQVVSGREPEKSNFFLREMAKAMKADPAQWARALEDLPPAPSTAPPPPRDTSPPPPPTHTAPPPPPDEESTDNTRTAAKLSPIMIETKSVNPVVKGRPGEKPSNWDEVAARTKDLRERAEAHGADVTGCSTFSNKALGTEILSIQKEITVASKSKLDDPLAAYDLPDEPENVDKLVASIEEQLNALRITNELMQNNEQILDQLTKIIIPQG